MFNQDQVKNLSIDTVVAAALVGRTDEIAYIKELKGWFEYSVDGAAVVDGITILTARGTDGRWKTSPAATATSILFDSSAGIDAKELPSATVAGPVLFYANADVLSNAATLKPATGEKLNGVIDQVFSASTYPDGSQFTVTATAVGEWWIEVTGAGTVAPFESTVAALTDVVLDASQTGTTLLYGAGTAGSNQISIESVEYYDVAGVRTITIDLYDFDDDLIKYNLGSNLLPAGAKIANVSTVWADPSIDVGTQPASHVELGVDNLFAINRINAVDGLQQQRITVTVVGVAGGQVVMAGMVQVGNLHRVNITQKVQRGTLTHTSDSIMIGDAYWDSVYDPQSLLDTANDKIVIGQDGTYKVSGAYSHGSNHGDQNLDILVDGIIVASTRADAPVAVSSVMVEWIGDLTAGQEVTFVGGDTAWVVYGGSFTVEQLPTSSVVNPGMVPVEDLASGVVTGITNNQTFTSLADVVGSDFTLPNIGTYEVEVQLPCRMTGITAQNGYIELVDSADTQIGGIDWFPKVLSQNEVLNFKARITTTAENESFKLRAFGASGNTIQVFNTNNASSNGTSGYARIFWRQNSTKTVTYVDPAFTEARALGFLQATVVGSISTTGTGYTLTKQDSKGTSVSIDGLGLKLEGGRSYQLQCSLNSGSVTGYIGYSITEGQNGPVVGTGGFDASPASGTNGSTRLANAFVSPAVDTTYFLDAASTFTGCGGYIYAVEIASAEYVTPGDVPVENLARAKMTQSAAQSLTGNSETQIQFNAKSYETDASVIEADLANNELAIKADGWYDITANILATNSSNNASYTVRIKNGSTVLAIQRVSATNQQDGSGFNLSTGYIELGFGDQISVTYETNEGNARVLVDGGVSNWVSINQAPSKTVINTTDTPVDDQAASGYIDIGSVRMQWGTVAAGVTFGDIVFPAQFLNTAYSFTTSVEYAGQDYVMSAMHSAKATTGIHYDTVQIGDDPSSPGGATEGFDWQAIGLKP